MKWPTAASMPRLFNGAGWSKWLGAVVVTAWALSAPAGADPGSTNFSPQQIEFYEKQVQPILAENCYKCHSHQADKIKGEFVLDSREGLLKGGETGPAIVAGEPEKSLLIKAVRQVDEDLQMPPKKKLTGEQIAALTEWVKIGAPYSAKPVAARQSRSKKITDEDRKWWSFQPVRRTPLVAPVPRVTTTRSGDSTHPATLAGRLHHSAAGQGGPAPP